MFREEDKANWCFRRERRQSESIWFQRTHKSLEKDQVSENDALTRNSCVHIVGQIRRNSIVGKKLRKN